MQTVGILGGLGPETTASFYLQIITACQQQGGPHRPHVLISSLPIPYTLETALLLHGQAAESYLPHLTHHAQLLEQAGADFIVMPCNTLHRFAANIKQAVNIPFLSIVDVVANYVSQRPPQPLGLIATGVTLASGFYQERLAAMGRACHTPNPFQQAKIAKLIHGLVNGQYANPQRQVLLDVIAEFADHGIAHVLLACTDLQALVPQHPELQIVDTMQLLAEAVVAELHG